MTHGELRVKFINYHQEKWPDRRLFDNRTGWAKFRGQHVPYGIPTPLKGKRKKAGGGGPDTISFGNEGGFFTAWFFELKTINDDMRPNQKYFADSMVSKGAKYFIVKERDEGFKVIQYLG